MSVSPIPQVESLLAFAQRIKSTDRARQRQLDPGAAQAEVENMLSPELWKISQPSQLTWPGDLGDEPDDPPWMASP